jgi:Glycosyltransferase family 87
MNQTGGPAFAPSDSRRPAKIAVATISASIALMIARGVVGPAKPLPIFAAAPPWPPWFVRVHLALWVAPFMSWFAVLLGAIGLVAALVAIRRGWQPSPKRLIAGSVLAVLALMLTIPVGSGDPLYYVAYGRIATLGHSVYVSGSNQFLSARDPDAAAVRQYVPLPPSRYGPAATLSEEVASAIAGDSPARNLFWLKVWNAVAYLALVFVLDRLTRPDRMRRVRAHVMWSLNPLMLYLVMADGHNDVLAVAMGATALFAVRKSAARHTFLAGILLVLATAVKASYALFGVGAVWALRRSPRALCALAAGAGAVLVPTYLLGGRRVVEATTIGLVGGEHTNLLYYEFTRFTGHARADKMTNVLGLLVCGALALVLLWRLPSGPPDLPGVRVALALSLALLIASPYQQAWYDAMIFPLFAVIAASRLDWIAAAHAIALTVISVPYSFSNSHPPWWSQLERFGSFVPVALALAATGAALLWLCWTRDWRQLPLEAPLPGYHALPSSAPAPKAVTAMTDLEPGATDPI